MNKAKAILDDVYRTHSRVLFARLVRALGDFDTAEDALQDALTVAAERWETQGIPDKPAAWLFTVARFRGIDSLRRRQHLSNLADYEGHSLDEVNEVGDELLRLVFTCCHPAISPDAQVALTLREVCELTTEEIARAFLIPVPTIAQRIVRAKAKIRQANIPFEIPAKEDLPLAMDSVRKTIYLVFSEGYSSCSGDNLIRPDLVSMAIHLAQQLIAIFPHPESNGLLALMLLHHSRSSTRLTLDGDIILLENQDRSLWNREMIVTAGGLVADALRSQTFGTYTVQAAIAAIHAEAPSYHETDWTEIVGLYDVLLRLQPSPIIELNRAVAVAMRDGPSSGIELINRLLSMPELAKYHAAYAARAGLYRRLGDCSKARSDYHTALTFVTQEAERRLLKRCLEKTL